MAARVASMCLLLLISLGIAAEPWTMNTAAQSSLSPVRRVCPAALPLTRDAPENVLALVRAEVPRLYGNTLSRGYLIRTMGEVALLTGQDRVYHDIALGQCGTQVAGRSWIVFLTFPAARPSASLSAGQLYVARTAKGWVIWLRYH